MAVIQDLPPELLDKIIGHTYEYLTSTRTDNAWRAGFALVARDWIEPGQRSLASHVRLRSTETVDRFVEFLKLRSSRTDQPFRIRSLEIGGTIYDDQEEQLGTLNRLLGGGEVVAVGLTVTRCSNLSFDAIKQCRKHFDHPLSPPRELTTCFSRNLLPHRCPVPQSVP